jgi:hypothetical protein
MGYAGYVPAKMPPAKQTPAEAALAAIRSEACLEVIGKLAYNAAVAPKDEKFRRVKLTNAKVKEAVVEAHGGVEALRELGFVDDAEAPAGEALVLPAGRYITMAEVRLVEAAKDRLKKELRTALMRGNVEVAVRA